MAKQSDLEEIRELLDSALVLENDKLVKVIVAIDSSKNKRMSDEEIQELTGLNAETIFKSIDILTRSDYISTVLQEIPNRSLHKVCRLTEKGERVLHLLEMNGDK